MKQQKLRSVNLYPFGGKWPAYSYLFLGSLSSIFLPVNNKKAHMAPVWLFHRENGALDHQISFIIEKRYQSVYRRAAIESRQH